MSRELVLKSLLAPLTADIAFTTVSAVIVLKLVPEEGVRVLVVALLAISSVAYAVILLRRTSRLARVAAVISSTCSGVIRYNYMRDVVYCLEGRAGSVRLLCYSAQEDRLYCADLDEPRPAPDLRDFYCVRFDGGEFRDEGTRSVYRGALRALTGSGVVAGRGVVSMVRLRGAGPEAISACAKQVEKLKYEENKE